MMPGAYVAILTNNNPPPMKSMTKEEIEKKMQDTLDNKPPALPWMTPD